MSSVMDMEMTTELLVPVAVTRVEGADFFVPEERFREGVADGVCIYNIGKRFKEISFGRIERDIAPATLCNHRLQEDSFDSQIQQELGDGCETMFCYLWRLIQRQGLGQEGFLRVDGYMNRAYISGWSVCVCWLFERGWCLTACSITGQRLIGSSIIARQSSY